MNKSHLIACICTFFLCASSLSAKAAFPETYNVQGQALDKRGEYRYVYRVFFKLYDVALFADEASSADSILAADVPFHLSFGYLRTIKKSIILKSADSILERNLSISERQSIAERVDQINKAYKTVREGDNSSLTYIPEVGTILKINEQTVVTIKGKDFAELYFKIWLGEKPISESLKAALMDDK